MSQKEQSYCQRKALPESEVPLHERIQQIMATRNEWNLYRRKCDFTGDEIISAYRPDSPYKVYKNEIWWGDEWDALDYGQDFDFTRSFFEQFQELRFKVPREGTSIFNSENCDFNSHTRESRNCYLNSLVAKCEDTHYSYWVVNDHDVLDCIMTNNSTKCYWCVDVENCYDCAVLQDSKDSSNCYFSYDLKNCKNCIFSNNLVGKEYYIENQQVTKEEFERVKEEFLNGSHEKFEQAKEKFQEIKDRATHRFAHNINCENVTGDHLLNSRNCELVFDGNDNEDAFNVVSLANSKDCYNVHSAGWPGCEEVYFCGVSRGSQDIAFCTYSWFSSGLMYSDSMSSCHDCFGCVGLKQKRNCILNKEYSKEEYERLKSKIIEHMKQTGEWGQFFPYEISPFAYNESAAQDYFPLNKDEAPTWTDFIQPKPKVSKTVTVDKIPDNSRETNNEILDWAIVCEVSGKPFKLIPAELKFYQEQGFPIPRQHPQVRHKNRNKMRNPYRLFERICSKCGKPIQSSYDATRKEKVYCEQCYLAKIY